MQNFNMYNFIAYLSYSVIKITVKDGWIRHTFTNQLHLGKDIINVKERTMTTNYVTRY